MKQLIISAILVIYLDWQRLFTDIQKIINIIATETKTHEQKTNQ